jgi:hypothetical protein
MPPRHPGPAGGEGEVTGRRYTLTAAAWGRRLLAGAQPPFLRRLRSLRMRSTHRRSSHITSATPRPINHPRALPIFLSLARRGFSRGLRRRQPQGRPS